MFTKYVLDTFSLSNDATPRMGVERVRRSKGLKFPIAGSTCFAVSGSGKHVGGSAALN